MLVSRNPALGLVLAFLAAAAVTSGAPASTGVTQHEYHQYQIRLKKRIIDGHIVRPPFKYPFVTALSVDTETNGELFACGGTLLNENWVLTAGQCSFTETAGNGGPEDWNRTHVETGRFDLRKTAEQEKRGRYGVDFQITHPNFFDIIGPLTNDVGLWRLNGQAKGAAKVQLATSANLTSPGTIATLAGWGRRNDSDYDRYPRQLEARIRLVSDAECKKRLPDSEEGPLVEPKIQLCGVGVEGKEIGISTGDSGSPLFVSQNGIPTIVGIASRSVVRNGTRYSIFTRVHKYVSWINKTIGANPPPKE